MERRTTLRRAGLPSVDYRGAAVPGVLPCHTGASSGIKAGGVSAKAGLHAGQKTIEVVHDLKKTVVEQIVDSVIHQQLDELPVLAELFNAPSAFRVVTDPWGDYRNGRSGCDSGALYPDRHPIVIIPAYLYFRIVYDDHRKSAPRLAGRWSRNH